MQALAKSYPDTAVAIGLDVTSPKQRTEAIEFAERRFGSIDILVNNAGIDFLGAITLIRLALPGMRKRGSGTIVNISSMDGLAGLASNGYYSASKVALEGATEALWQEIEPLGLKAVLVEPGSFRTGIIDN
jgi:NAD(P)-dependent dehydrogenase (short-subunit alcohol dehydrogenase family)